MKPILTIVFIHGLANSHAMWTDIIDKLDKKHIRIVSVDLLGFGASPKPPWQTYSAAVHARSLRLTLLRLGVKFPVILVGHSLGALVAVQYASRYKHHVQELLLCSPPFYKSPKPADKTQLLQLDDAYRIFYRKSRYRHELAKRMALLMKSARLLSRHFTVTEETMPAIVSSLEMSIENQTSLEDAKKLRIPIHILYGQFDPFVLKSRLRELKAANTNISITTLPVVHEITGVIYSRAVLSKINSCIESIDKP